MKVAREFKEFVLRGNVVDLAVGIVIGAAFGAVVAALVKDLITPLVGMAGKFNFSALKFTVNQSVFLYGDFLNALVTFIILAIVVFFFVVKPINSLVDRTRRPAPPAPVTTKTCPYCFSEINLAASKCPYCTADLLSEAPAAVSGDISE